MLQEFSRLRQEPGKENTQADDKQKEVFSN